MDDLGKEGKGRHDLLLQEIEAIDDYWGPTFRYNPNLLIRDHFFNERFVSIVQYSTRTSAMPS